VRSRETDLRTNRFWIGWLASAYKYGDDPALVLDTAPFLARVKSDLVKASAKRYLDGKQYYEAVMLPENADTAATEKPASAKPADKAAKPAEKK
jgi:zinc protease